MPQLKDKSLKSGLTLVELLVVIVISLIVSGVAFSVYRLNASYYYREDAYLQQYQNLRVALYTISRDVRMAGNGFSVLGPSLKQIQVYTPTMERATCGSPATTTVFGYDWFRHSNYTSYVPPDTCIADPSAPGCSGGGSVPCSVNPADTPGVRAIFGIDGGEYDSDSITIFRSEIESGELLGKLTAVSGNKITITPEAETSDKNFEKAILPGDILALVNGENAVVLEVAGDYIDGDTEIPIKTGGRFTPNSLTSIPYLSGSFIYNFRDVTFVTYYVDQEKNQLMADYHDRTKIDDGGADRSDDPTGRRSFAVAYNVEDLQIYYFFDDVNMVLVATDPAISTARLDDQRIRAVAIGITSRSPYGEGARNKFRPALFNRRAGTDRDDRVRSTLVQTIYLRNYQQ
jgi:prepilin-type N-terminal cleavage/methylation domain-containing protein